ncbi:MAG: CopG family transcriptional regulator [Microthrixaceae bacterium]|nr:hypothetical protein [Acidimicrobiales bacterium]MCB9404462.1 CopG family transcriptional regulator [Microthrixaceae bacterium]
MAVISIRFTDQRHHERLKVAAQRRGMAVSPLAEQLIEEGLRMQDHPRIVFREGPAGRRATVIGGPEVADVIGAIVGGDVADGERRSRAAELLALSPADVDAAMAYYADFTEEIDGELRSRQEEADALEARWRRAQALLGS